MPANLDQLRAQARKEAEDMFHAIASAEQIIVASIERECEALRSGRMLAARALHTQLCDAARIYLDATRAAQASIETLDYVAPGMCDRLEARRVAFSSLLKVELAVLASERAAAFGGPRDEPLLAASPAPDPAPARRPGAPRLVAVSGGAPKSPRRRAG